MGLAWVVEGHVEVGEGDHLCAEGGVEVVEWCAFEVGVGGGISMLVSEGGAANWCLIVEG